ncbi:MAG: 50S ribosomal protein L22 [Candidatus Colwellbacteria bacterium]|nr:50S ribosomal protein L22 [Candidatus Colwellbacteria bacterium]
MTEVKAKAKLKNLRIAPRKVRQTINPIRGLTVNEALGQLELMNTRSALPLSKLIRSATANARAGNLSAEQLFIASIRVDEGPTLKRTLPGARGRATLVRKRWSHVTVLLGQTDKKSRFIIPETQKKVKKDTGRVPRPKAPQKKAGTAGKEKAAKRGGFVRKVFSRRKAI